MSASEARAKLREEVLARQYQGRKLADLSRHEAFNLEDEVDRAERDASPQKTRAERAGGSQA